MQLLERLKSVTSWPELQEIVHPTDLFADLASTGELYAMKVLTKHKIFGNNLVRYAKTERDVLSYTKHPFIVSLNYAF